MTIFYFELDEKFVANIQYEFIKLKHRINYNNVYMSGHMPRASTINVVTIIMMVFICL